MAQNNNSRVNGVLESIKINPFSDSTTPNNNNNNNNNCFTLPLTHFDNFWLKFPPVERLFFYQLNDSESDDPNVFNSQVLPNLKHSLSLTLLHYLPLAGNLMWPEDTPKPAVYYFPNSDDGVSVTVAESNADFNHLCANGIRRAVEFHPLVPRLSISDDKAEVIAIQITLFPPNEGFSIGISSHHAVLDGKSTTMFMKSWAYICKRLQNPATTTTTLLLPEELTPCLDRSVIKDPKGLDVVYANHWMDFSNNNNISSKRSLNVIPMKEVNSNLVRMTFELSREDIGKLRNKVLLSSNNNSKEEEIHLSTYVLTCAHVYVCLLKAQVEEEAADDTSVAFGVAADCRSRLNPPLPVNYFGNCVGGNGTLAKASDLIGGNGFAFVAEKLSDFIKELKEDVNVIEGSEDKIVMLITMIKGGLKARGLSVAGSNRFDVYGTDFGWGRPKKVEVVSIDKTEAISLAESRDGGGGGVEVGVVLEKPQMEVFASLFDDGLKDV